MHKTNVTDLAKTLCHLAKSTSDPAARRQRVDQLIRLCEVSLGKSSDSSEALRVSGPEFTRWYREINSQQMTQER